MNDKKTFQKELGERIKSARTSRGMTRAQLAEKADVSDQYVYEIESGLKGCSAMILLRISAALGASADYLLTGEKSLVQPRFAEFAELLSQLPEDMLPWARMLLFDFTRCILSREGSCRNK